MSFWNGGPGAPRLLAHRGASLDAPENTMAAFTLARSQGAHGLELDVRLTRDNVPVVVHDPDLRRVAGIPREPRGMTLAELQAVDVGGWFSPQFKGERAPTLKEVIAKFGDLFLDVEIKTDDGTSPDALVEAVLKELEQAPHPDRVLVSSFDPFVLGIVRETAPHLATGGISEGPLEEDDVLFLAEVSDAIIPEAAFLTLETVEWVRAENLGLFPWTVNDPRAARRLLDMGVDGLITDVPAQLAKALR
ncbi:MAG TPA: glycerophosphodiester phosphodiesterase family protein [Candidatus Thermoplasmatota archaeon]|nr:glycerophosphodiester phosphodiesterase family protein [Candidatus Thermoplasmatota archaeon]